MEPELRIVGSDNNLDKPFGDRIDLDRFTGGFVTNRPRSNFRNHVDRLKNISRFVENCLAKNTHPDVF